MLRQDKTAKWVEEPSGCLNFSGPVYRFHCKSPFTPAVGRPVSHAEFKELQKCQQQEPICVIIDVQSSRKWWMYEDEFYWEDQGLTAIEVKALITQRKRAQRKKIDHAVAMLDSDQVNSSTRVPIPSDVKQFVWNRDGGKCVRCESNQKLEFDHIIPIAMGGSNTARNLQLLCETCNRSKGATLT